MDRCIKPARMALAALLSLALVTSLAPSVALGDSASLTAAAITTQATTSLRDQYYQVLTRASNGSGEFSEDYRMAGAAAWAPTYFLFDLESNGIPELFVTTQAFAGAKETRVYSYGANAAIAMGSYISGTNYKNNSGGLWTVLASDKTYIAKVSYSGGTVFSKFVKSTTAAEATTYMKGVNATVIKETKTSDYSLLTANAKQSIASAILTITTTTTYNGIAQTPAVNVRLGNITLTKDVDYTVSYNNNINAGIATAIVTGINNYGGSASKAFAITPASISHASVSKIAPTTYTGKAIKPKPKVTYKAALLKAGRDYRFAYKNNVKAGYATATIIGKGNLSGSKVAYFKINKASIHKASVSKIAKKKYTNKAIKPKPKVKYKGKKLKPGRDYKLTYKHNTQRGTATITIVGKGSFKGSKKTKFAIY